VTWTADELSFLLTVARVLVGRRSLAMSFVRELEGVTIEAGSPYGPSVAIRVIVDGPHYARSPAGSVLAAHDVVTRLVDKLRRGSWGPGPTRAR
jgi:hypothetical protein